MLPGYGERGAAPDDRLADGIGDEARLLEPGTEVEVPLGQTG